MQVPVISVKNMRISVRGKYGNMGIGEYGKLLDWVY